MRHLTNCSVAIPLVIKYITKERAALCYYAFYFRGLLFRILFWNKAQTKSQATQPPSQAAAPFPRQREGSQQRRAAFPAISQGLQETPFMPATFLSLQDRLLQFSQVTLNSTFVTENIILSSSHILYSWKEKGTVKNPDLRQNFRSFYQSFHLSAFSNEQIYLQPKHSLKIYSCTFLYCFFLC